jgi:hypothetical protein
VYCVLQVLTQGMGEASYRSVLAALGPAGARLSVGEVEARLRALLRSSVALGGGGDAG